MNPLFVRRLEPSDPQGTCDWQRCGASAAWMRNSPRGDLYVCAEHATTALVDRDADGVLVLDDPVAREVMAALDKTACDRTFEAQRDRVEYFVGRMRTLGRGPADTVVVLINVDDANGAPLAQALMPGHDWSEVRERGEVPFARGLAGREGVQTFVDAVDRRAGGELSRCGRELTHVPVVVVDHGSVAVYAWPWTGGT